MAMKLSVRFYFWTVTEIDSPILSISFSKVGVALGWLALRIQTVRPTLDFLKNSTRNEMAGLRALLCALTETSLQNIKNAESTIKELMKYINFLLCYDVY